MAAPVDSRVRALMEDDAVRKLLTALLQASPDVPERDSPTLLRVSEVQTILRRSRARVYEMCATGELESIRDGRSILVPRDAVEAWISRKRRARR